ncbi:MAG TPA: flagellar hook-length control protein FliK [Terriglobales bacterium]
MISAISQLAAKTPQTGAPPAATGSSADIFLSLLTQEFQTSNGLVDPSLANLNSKQTAANVVDPNKADPKKADLNATDSGTATASNSAIGTKRLGDKDKDKSQSLKADDTAPAPTAAVPTIPLIPTPVPVQVQPQPQINVTADQANTSTDDAKKIAATPQFASFMNGGKNNDLQINSAYTNSANQIQADKAQDANAADETDDENASAGTSAITSSNTNASSITSASDAPQASDALVKPVISAEIAKPSINTAMAALKHAAVGNSNKEKPVAPDADLTAQAPATDPNTAPVDATTVASNPTAAVLNATTNQATAAGNEFIDAKQANQKDSDAAVQVSGIADIKSKDSVAAAKSAFKKDEGQLNQQDSQQAPAQSSNDPQLVPVNSAFHSAVAQQVHATSAASGTMQHSPVNTKSTSTGNNPPSVSQEIAGAAAQDSTLPASSGPLQSAKLVERLGQAELRVGLQVGDMGGVDIRTSMAHNQLTAEISVEHSELGHMLAANLPSLQNKLSEHQIQTANITFQNQMSGNSSQSEQRSRQGSSSQAQTPIERIPYGEAESFSRMSASSSESVETQAGLDIHI